MEMQLIITEQHKQFSLINMLSMKPWHKEKDPSRIGKGLIRTTFQLANRIRTRLFR